MLYSKKRACKRDYLDTLTAILRKKVKKKYKNRYYTDRSQTFVHCREYYNKIQN